MSKIPREELRRLIDLPMKIYGTLTYVSMTPNGELVLYVEKENKYKLKEIANILKQIEGRELYLLLDIGNWE